MLRLNIVIPAYNEEKRLPLTLSEFGAVLEKLEQRQIDPRVYIIDDGSKDRTGAAAQALAKEHKLPLQVLDYGENRGKGAAVKHGMLNSRPAELYYLADADYSADWEQMLKLIEKIEERDDGARYDCVIGSRATADAQVSTQFSRKFSGRASNFLIRLVLGLNFADTQCGYKLFRSSCLPAFKLQKIDRFGFDFEVLYLLDKLNLSVKEVGIKWENREGSKVKPSDYLKTFSQLLKVRFGSYPATSG